MVGVSFIGLLLLGAALTLGALALAAEHDFSVAAIEEAIRSWGAWSIAASIGLMILHSFAPFPAELLAIANGMLFGPVWGVVITWTGAMLGAILAFGLARALGRPFVETLVARRDWQRMDEWAASQGGRMVLVGRLIPVISFNLINFSAGLTRISWWTFIWATGIGILPITILAVVLGDRIDSMTWELWLIGLAAVLALWFIFRGRLRAWAGRPGPHGGNPARGAKTGAKTGE